MRATTLHLTTHDQQVFIIHEVFISCINCKSYQIREHIVRCFIPDAVTPSVSLSVPLAAAASSRWTCSPSRCLLSTCLHFLQATVIPNLVKMMLSNNPTTALNCTKKQLHHHLPLHLLVHLLLHLLVHLLPLLPLECYPTMLSSLMSLLSQPVPKLFPAPPLQLLQ